MTNYVVVEILENASDPNSTIIGAAIFDLELENDAGMTFSEPTFDNFIALISDFHPNDVNFDGTVSFGESFAAFFLPDNLGQSRFTQYAFEYLSLETLDPRFGQLADQAFISMAQNLVQQGLSDVYGIESSFIHTLASAVASPVISLIANRAANGIVSQFFVQVGLEAIVQSLIGGAFEPDPTAETQYEYLNSSNGSFTSGSTDYVFILSEAGVDANISTGNGNDILVGNSGDDTFNGGAGADAIFGGAGNDNVTGAGSLDLRPRP